MAFRASSYLLYIGVDFVRYVHQKQKVMLTRWSRYRCKTVYQAGTSAWRVPIREPLPPLQTKSKGVSIPQLLAYQIDIVTYLARHVASSDTANAGISKPSYSRRPYSHSRCIQVYPFQLLVPINPPLSFGCQMGFMSRDILLGHFHAHKLGEVWHDCRMSFESVQEWSIGTYIPCMQDSYIFIRVCQQEPSRQDRQTVRESTR